MAQPSSHPVANPVLAPLFLAHVQAANEANSNKPKAYPTWFRYSDSLGCETRLTFDAAGYSRSDAMDGPGHVVTSRGSWDHERFQAALTTEFGLLFTAEVPSRFAEITSGSADGILAASAIPALGRTAWELKNRGGYKFDQAVGLNRRLYREQVPEGPDLATRTQGALNALANDCDTLVIVYTSMEAVSMQLAERLGWGEVARICAEWHYSRIEFEPWAYAELSRLESLVDRLAAGEAPDRVAIGDEGEEIHLDPNANKPSWQCVYCPHKTTCAAGTVPLVIRPAYMTEEVAS